MKFCTKCGAGLPENASFCPSCGEKTFDGEQQATENKEENAQIENVNETENANVNPYSATYSTKSNDAPAQPAAVDTAPAKEKGPWRAFSVIGKVFAIIGFIWSFLPIANLLSFISSIPGLVFSILGKKSPSKRKKAKRGVGLSVASMIITVVITLLIIAAIFFLVYKAVGYIKGVDFEEAFEGVMELLEEDAGPALERFLDFAEREIRPVIEDIVEDYIEDRFTNIGF